MKPGTTELPPASITRVAGPRVSPTARAIADGDDGPVADRNRLGARLVIVHGEDAGVGDDEIGVLRHDCSRLGEASIAAERRARPAGCDGLAQRGVRRPPPL